MKGRKLTLEEVLNLEDGDKVWVEDDDEGDKQVGTIRKEYNGLELMEDSWFYLDDLPDEEYVRFYEWIEDKLTIPDQIETPYYSENIVNKMSVEICNLRGLDLTDDNIRLIVEEFSK